MSNQNTHFGSDSLWAANFDTTNLFFRIISPCGHFRASHNLAIQCPAADVEHLEEEIDDIQCNEKFQKIQILWCVIWCVVESGTISTQKYSLCAVFPLVCCTKRQNTPKGTFLINWITFGVSFPVLCTKNRPLKLNLSRAGPSQDQIRKKSDLPK